MSAIDKATELALKEYEVLTVDVLKAAIVDIEFQKIMDKYLDEAKKRIVRQRQDEAKNYEPTDVEIEECLQAKLNVFSEIGEI